MEIRSSLADFGDKHKCSAFGKLELTAMMLPNLSLVRM
jgi:hypothetical protein